MNWRSSGFWFNLVGLGVGIWSFFTNSGCFGYFISVYLTLACGLDLWRQWKNRKALPVASSERP
jgi:hypothetical protein